jgi:hypothetical protein
VGEAPKKLVHALKRFPFWNHYFPYLYVYLVKRSSHLRGLAHA